MGEHIDGNALAGPLSDLFTFDPTTASARCSGCGDVSVLARAMVYAEPDTLVVRCAHCDDVLMTIVQAPDRFCIELRGMTWLKIPR
ncbi:DUF6510 family protein [Cryobacterium sp. Y29]|uniref:DUF6510 family protein n=1 Tax=Cryobacterium sp. Y29 TaxID=2048285 RepID=UPI000CE357EC|nr:DUF6510 family protein [Cryobacterium sp. Y29]